MVCCLFSIYNRVYSFKNLIVYSEIFVYILFNEKNSLNSYRISKYEIIYDISKNGIVYNDE